MSQVQTARDRQREQYEASAHQQVEMYRRILAQADERSRAGDVVLANQRRREAGEYWDTRMNEMARSIVRENG